MSTGACCAVIRADSFVRSLAFKQCGQELAVALRNREIKIYQPRRQP